MAGELPKVFPDGSAISLFSQVFDAIASSLKRSSKSEYNVAARLATRECKTTNDQDFGPLASAHGEILGGDCGGLNVATRGANLVPIILAGTAWWRVCRAME